MDLERNPMNHYTTLGVLPSATIAEITSRFRAIAMRTHPDRNGGDPKLTERFIEAQEAYEILRDPERRAAYDQKSLSKLIEDPAVAAKAAWDDFLNSTLTQPNSTRREKTWT